MSNPHDLITLGAAEIARRIRARQVSVSDVVDAHIQRIVEVNPRLNAVVVPNFEQARAEARAADERLARAGDSDLPPLFGVPVTIKDCFPVEGLRCTAGSWFLRNSVAGQDAAAVRRLREAGAIILGKTNLPDMCWMIETENPVFGRTNNPRDPRRTVGGSSGGEGAIIAAGGSPLGLGSDVAGSVRVPAAATGIVSLKPSAGRTPTGGHLPDLEPVVPGWNTAGPLARRVEDLALALSVLSETPVADYRAVSLEGRRLLPYALFGSRQQMRETVQKATGALERAGMHRAANVRLPVIPTLLTYSSLMGRRVYPAAYRALGGGRPYDTRAELQASLRGQSQINPQIVAFMALTDWPLRLLPLLGFDERRLERLRERFLTMMGDGGLIVTNVLRCAAPHHGWGWRMAALPIANTMIYNALGFPSVVVPVGWTGRRLPLAVQVVARPGEDEVALAAAAELERAFGGWRLAMA